MKNQTTPPHRSAKLDRDLSATRYNSVFNVTDYGIYPNGTDVKDSLVSLIRLVNNSGGGTIFFPKGIYVIKSEIEMSGLEGIAFEGVSIPDLTSSTDSFGDRPITSVKGSAIYFNPVTSIELVNPTTLTASTWYKVKSGTITYNSTAYTVGETFHVGSSPLSCTGTATLNVMVTGNHFDFTDCRSIGFKNISLYSDYGLGSNGNEAGGLYFRILANDNNPHHVLENVWITNCNGAGLVCAVPIMFIGSNVKISNCAVTSLFNFYSGTSVTLNSCYAITGIDNGFYFSGMTYCDLNACAAETVRYGYRFSNSNAMSLNGCGTEAIRVRTSTYTYAYYAESGSRVVLTGCYNTRKDSYIQHIGESGSAFIDRINFVMSDVYDATATHPLPSPTSRYYETKINANFIDTATPEHPTYRFYQDFIDQVNSSGIINDDFTFTGGTSSIGTVGVIQGMIKTSNSLTAPTKFFDIKTSTTLSSLTEYTTEYVYIDYNAGNPIVTKTTDRSAIHLYDHIILGGLYREGTTVKAIKASIYLSNFVRRNHERLIARGTIDKFSGMVISGDATRHLLMTEGVVYVAMDKYSTTAFDSNSANFEHYYYKLNGAWTVLTATGIVNNTQYNNVSTPDSESLATTGANKYVCHHIYGSYDGKINIILGKNEYVKQSDAEQESITSVPSYVQKYCTYIARVITKQGTSTIVNILNISSSTSISTGIINHNELNKLDLSNTISGHYLTSPDGHTWGIVIDNAGKITSTLLT